MKTMITEDYVSFETAKLLIKKNFGYNAEYESYYTFHGEIVYFKDDPKVPNMAPRITLQMAMKWLREEKGIAIIPILSSVLDSKEFLWDIKIVVAKTNETYSQGWIYEKYERAVEAAIKYCLENLI